MTARTLSSTAKSCRCRVRDREVELDRLAVDLLAGQKVFLTLSPKAVRQILSGPQALRGAARAGTDRRGHRPQLQFVRRVSRRLRPCARVGRYARGPRAPQLRDLLGAVRPEFRSHLRHRRRCNCSFPSIRADGSRCCAARWDNLALPVRIAEARAAGWPSPCTSSRAIGAFNGGASSTPCAPRSNTTAGRLRGSPARTLPHGTHVGPQPPLYKAVPGHALQKIPPRPSPSSSSEAARVTGISRHPVSRRHRGALRHLPYDVQRLAQNYGTTARADASRTDSRTRACHVTLKRLLGEHQTLFEATWQRSPCAAWSIAGRRVSKRDASYCPPTSRARYRLTGASTVQARLRRSCGRMGRARGHRYGSGGFPAPGVGGETDVLNFFGDNGGGGGPEEY